MDRLPKASRLLRIFAITEHFGVIADTPYGCGYRLGELAVAVSFFGHDVYFCVGDAALCLGQSGKSWLMEPDARDNDYLMSVLAEISTRYAA